MFDIFYFVLAISYASRFLQSDNFPLSFHFSLRLRRYVLRRDTNFREVYLIRGASKNRMDSNRNVTASNVDVPEINDTPVTRALRGLEKPCIVQNAKGLVVARTELFTCR